MSGGRPLQQLLPRQVCWPSLIASAAMASAIAGSAHQRPNAAFSARLASTAADSGFDALTKDY